MVTLHCRCPKHTLSLSGNLVLLGHQRIPSRYGEAGMKEWSQAGAGRWRGETEGGKGKGQRWGELETRQWQSKVRAFDSCQLKPRENFTDDLNPAFSFYRGETITHGWWLTQGQNCWFEARTEIWVSWCLLRALSSRHTSASHSQGMGDQGSDKQHRKALAVSPTSAPCVDRVNRRGRRDQAPGYHVAFDEAIWPSNRIHRTRNVWGQSVSQPEGSLAGSGSGLTIHGMKAYGTRSMHPLHSRPPSCLHGLWYMKGNHHWAAGFLDFLTLKRAQLWRIYRVRIRHITNCDNYFKNSLEGMPLQFCWQ